MMIVHVVALKAEEAPARRMPRRRRRPAAPAEPEVIKKGKVEKDEDEAAKRERSMDAAPRAVTKRDGCPDEACRRSRQSRARSTPAPGTTSASMSSICWPSGIGSSGSRRRPKHSVAKWRARGGDPRQAADVHEPERPGASASCCGSTRSTSPDLFVIVDDVNLELGRLRARPSGSAGGHNGLKSIIGALGTEEFARLRVGVGRGDARRDLADHVLAKFEPDERDDIAEATGRAADAAELFVAEGIVPVMNRFNRKEDGD